MTKPVTLKDIAQTLGLSISTVGRALSDDPQIGRPTRERVKAAAAELGYVAHSAARAMRSGRSALVGLIIPDIENEFYGTLSKALAETVAAAGLQLVLAITEDDPDSEERQVRGLLEARAAGLVITASPRPTRATSAMLARSASVQLIRRIDGLAAPWFGIDDAEALRRATQYLIGLGHERIGYVGASTTLSTGRNRFAGYQAALREAGYAEHKELIAIGAPRPAFGAEAFDRLWQARPRPTAIVTAGTRLTVGVLQAAARAGIVLPRDLSLVSYGDAPWWHEGLTSIALPVREIALACGAFLVQHIRAADGKPAGAPPGAHEVTFASRLTPGHSTAPR